MSKKKAPALHERRGREDISTRPPRLAGYPIKLAGDARLHRLSLAADSCVNRKYYGGDPGVGQRKTGLHTIPPSGMLRRRPGARFPLGQVLGSLGKHIKWPSARAESTENSPCIRSGRSYGNFTANPRVRWPARPTHNPYVGGLMCCVPDGYKVEMKVDRRWRPSSRSLSETQ